MENVLLIVLLVLALALIAIVLMQRSEGGGLGIGGGGGGGMSTGRGQATALGKMTWILGAGFMVISLVMTVLSAQNTSGTSVIDQLGTEVPANGDDLLPTLPSGDSLLPPTADDTPLTPRADE